MSSFQSFASWIYPDSLWPLNGTIPWKRILQILGFFVVGMILFLLVFHVEPTFADTGQLPGEDASGKLEAAGTLLRLLDTGLFKWGARIFAGICIMSAAWSLKEQRFGIAIICVAGAILFGTAPKWVKNIFDIGDNQSIFSSAPQNVRIYIAWEGAGRKSEVAHA